MGLFEQFPYTNYHDLNLDWIIQKVKEAYSPDNPPEFAVLSVNGETGAVILYKNAVVQLPTIEAGTWNLFRKADNSDEGIQFIKGQPAQRISGTNRYNIYDQGNPPPYPVTSVDGSTGAVSTWANTGSDNITLPHEAEGDSWTLRREGPSGYLGIEFDLDDSDNPSGFFILKPENESIQKVKILTPADIPSESGVVSINGEAGVVVLYAGDVKMASDDNTTVKAAIEGTRALTAAAYDSTASYSAGDFCTYQGVFYVCTGSTTGSWDSTKWTATTVDTQLKAASTRIGQNEAIVAYPENGSTAGANYTVGQYIARNGSLYKVIANISSGDAFSSSNISAVDNLGKELSDFESVTPITITPKSGFTILDNASYACGRMVTIAFRVSGTITRGSQFATVPAEYQPRGTNYIFAVDYTNDTFFPMYLKSDGTFEAFGSASAVRVNFTYMITT